MALRKKSILVDAHIFDKEPQGTTTYIRGIYNAFIDKFKDTYDIFITANDITLLEKDFPGLDKKNFIKLPKCNSISRLVKVLPGIIKQHNIDYAHFQQIASVVKACKYITTVHDLLFNEFPGEFSFPYRLSRNILFKKSLALSDIKLTVSHYSMESIKRFYNIENVFVTPNAVSEVYFRPFDKNKAIEFIWNKYHVKNYILFVSRIEERKNHLLLLKAYKQLRLYEKGISLVFVGRNDIPVKELENEINGLTEQEKEHFFWFKNVTDIELLELYRAATLFVYPSKAEGFGIPPLEAAALKINTMCSNVTAMKDFDFFGENHFNPGNYNELLEKLSSNITNPPSSASLEEISSHIRQRYSWYAGAQTINNLIQNDIKKSGNY